MRNAVAEHIYCCVTETQMTALRKKTLVLKSNDAKPITSINAQVLRTGNSSYKRLAVIEILPQVSSKKSNPENDNRRFEE